ncbi:MAG: MraY family glycosyltransferase, partial [Sulfurimonadaceae bacterium]
MLLEFVLILIVALILIKILVVNALKLGLLDVPNTRSMHVRHHPRGAGIGFFLAVALVEPFFHFDLLLEHFLTLAAVLLVFAVGVFDDYRDPPPVTKVIVTAIGALLVYFDGIYVSSLGTLFGLEMCLGLFALPFTVVAIVGFTNALNLVDGLDGLAGSISIIILGTLFIIGYDNGDDFMMMLSGSFIAALLAFMVYNWNPASIFMG